MTTGVVPPIRSDVLGRPYPPVFLLGLHRTGSTWLHAMLARTGCFRVVTAHHVICWDEYANGGRDRGPSRERLAARFQKLGLADRGIDAVEVRPDLIEATSQMALIATVGRGMAHIPGMAAKLFEALSQAKINIRMIDQGSSELNIIVGIHADDFESAMRVIYKAFVG